MLALDIVFNLFTFIIGITFGSFFTLAVYRIPLRQDITHTRSYCPNCNHKLSFFDLIPVFSYIFLRGRCRYCNTKIRIRYLLLEILSGIVFVLFAFPLKEELLLLRIPFFAYFVTGILYISGFFILAGIDKEKHEIRNEVVLYIVIIETIYIIYLYIFEKINVHRYVMYLFVIVLLIVVNNFYFRKKLKNSYTIQCLILLMIMLIFTYEQYVILTVIFTLLILAIKEVIVILERKKFVKIDSGAKKTITLPIAYYMCISHLIILIFANLSIFIRT